MLVCLAVCLTCGADASGAPAGTKSIFLTPLGDVSPTEKYAIVIGVTDYESCPKLTVCANDARDFADLLKSPRYGFDSVVLMTDDPDESGALRPTQRHIQKALETMYRGIVKNKTEVVFFYSGHGTRAKDASGADADWLVPEDGDPSDVSGTCINYKAIVQTLDTLLPRRVVLITDACRDMLGAKGVGSSGFGTGIHGPAPDPEVAELYSCRPTETSLEGDPKDFQESVFTHFLDPGA